MMLTALSTGASGFRSSWASSARNSSFRRSAAFSSSASSRRRSVGRLQLGGALGNAALQLAGEPLGLDGLPPELGEDADLGAEELGLDGHRHVVDGPGGIALEAVHVGEVHGGHEDDRGLPEAGMLADDLGQLEAVEVGHAHVHQDEGDLLLEQVLERLASRTGLDEVGAELVEHGLVA